MAGITSTGANEVVIPDPGTELPAWDGYLTGLGAGFVGGAAALKDRVNAASEELKRDPSNPTKMSAFVTAFQESIAYMNLESNTIKGMKDLVAGMISNMR